jgi:CheY-like chemotaxis protein
MTDSDTNETKQVKILVAEDNPAVREFVVRALKTDDRKIVDVEDGQQALAVLNQESFDVLIADIVMPNLDGIALALKASRQYPDLRIIMISGYAQERMRAHNLDALVHRIIAKPFSLEEISEAVQDVLALPSGGN